MHARVRVRPRPPKGASPQKRFCYEREGFFLECQQFLSQAIPSVIETFSLVVIVCCEGVSRRTATAPRDAVAVAFTAPDAVAATHKSARPLEKDFQRSLAPFSFFSLRGDCGAAGTVARTRPGGAAISPPCFSPPLQQRSQFSILTLSASRHYPLAHTRRHSPRFQLGPKKGASRIASALAARLTTASPLLLV